MKRIMLATIASAMLLAPVAGATPPVDHPGQSGAPKAQKESKAKAYGKYCQGQSKKHVKGQKGTDFSRCVNALAKADRNDETTARQACAALSKKHVKGIKGTPFSRCVVGVAQMRKDQ